MRKKRRRSRKHSNRFRFETPLTPDAAMERLHDLAPVKKATFDYPYRHGFQVKSQMLDNTIYFEIQVIGSAYLGPTGPGPTVRGQIRAINSTRTLVEGDLCNSPLLKFIGLVFATVLGGGSILFFLSGYMPSSDFFTIVGVTVVSIALIRVFATGKGGRNPTIDRIEQQIGAHREDHGPGHEAAA